MRWELGLRAVAAVRRASRRALRIALRHESGIAAVEFSLILPIMVVLWISGVEVTQGLSVDRRLNNLASSIGDLVSRRKSLTFGQVDNIFDIAPGAMYPYCKSAAACTTIGLQMRVSAVAIDGSQNAKVAWSRARGNGISAYGDNTVLNTTVVPNSLRTADTQIIMAEVFVPYKPAVGYMITSTITLEDRMYFVPRLVDKVKLCDNNNANCKPT